MFPNSDVLEKATGSTGQDTAPSSYSSSIEVLEHSGGTKRGLKALHAQPLALGDTIGMALFVSSGVTLLKGGPSRLLFNVHTHGRYINFRDISKKA